MAIVPDRSGNGSASLMAAGVDQKFCTPNRTGAATPNGTVTPLYAGERYHDTTGFVEYQAIGVANNTWLAVTTPKMSGA